MARVMATKEQQINDLTEQVEELRRRLNDKSSEFDSLCIRYEDDTGHVWDGRAFADDVFTHQREETR